MTDAVKRIMKQRQQLVRDNMRNMLQATPSKPTMPSDAIILLRARLILEEALETIAGLGVTVALKAVVHDEENWFEVCKLAKLEFEKNKPTDLLEVVDGLADLDYVGPCGTAVAFGVELDPIFMEVHRSNMTKCWTDQEVAVITDETLEIHPAPEPQGDRKWVVLQDGKYVKSPSYSPADIKRVLMEQFK